MNVGSISQLFERQVERRPKQCAVIFNDRHFSYGELNRRANQLAHYLRGLGVGRETLVAICVEPSFEMMVAILGVVKAGGAYVPLVADHPSSRVVEILEDTEASILLLQRGKAGRGAHEAGRRAQLDRFDEYIEKKVYLDEDWGLIAQENSSNPLALSTPDNLLNVIYTSSSTGKAKGVLIPMSCVLNRLSWMWEAYPFRAGEVAVLVRSYAVVSAAWDYLGALLMGIPTLILSREQLTDPSRLWNQLVTHQVSRILSTPSFLQLLIEQGALGRGEWKSLCLAVAGGEMLFPAMVKRWYEIFPQTTLLNVYGTTETASTVTAYDTSQMSPDATRVPIGKPFPNVQVDVLDDALEPVPAGQVGELCVAGVSVTRGYLKLPDLTRARFISKPCSEQSTQKALTKKVLTVDPLLIPGEGEFALTGMPARPTANPLPILSQTAPQVREGGRVSSQKIGVNSTQTRQVLETCWVFPRIIEYVRGRGMIKSERLYRTGDFARYLPDGNLEIIGRKDHQVKIRGFRVQLGEVERELSKHKMVSACACKVYENNPSQQELVAYVRATEGITPKIKELRHDLSQKLPDHMVPARFVLLDAFPMTTSGKIDRLALPAPDQVSVARETTFVAPRDELERKLLKIWQQLFGRRQIGIRDHFFELGGNSLLLMRLLTHIRSLSGQSLEPGLILQAPTIEQLADELREKLVVAEKASAESSLVPIQPNGSKPPIFCMTAVKDEVFIFANLARHLGSDQPCYALQQGLKRGLPVHARLEELAARYIKEIRTIQPNGPYFLLGYCFGGLVAFEMAQQLRAQNEQMALLALVESYVPGSLHLSRLSLTQKVRKYVGYFLENNVKEEFLYVINRTKKICKEKIWGNTWNKSYDYYQAKGRPLPKFLRKVSRISVRLAKEYTPQCYRGDVTLFQVEERLPEYNYPAQMGWGEYVAGEITIHDLPGEHISTWKEPHVEVMAQKLKAYL